MALRKSGDRTLKEALLLSRKDLFSIVVGFLISLCIGLAANRYVLRGFLRAFGLYQDVNYGEFNTSIGEL